MNNPHKLQNPANPTGRDENATPEASIVAAIETLQWLDPLCEFPHFRTFMEKVVGPLMKTARDKALDIATPLEEVNNARQQLHALSQVFNWPAVARTLHRETLQAEEKRQKAKQEAQETAKPVPGL